MTQPATTEEVEAFRSAQEKEYGQFVAVAPINFGNARAFNIGDPVPASHVKKYGYLEQKLVAKAETKAAAAATDPAAKG